jgi:hypothetical protein
MKPIADINTYHICSVTWTWIYSAKQWKGNKTNINDSILLMFKWFLNG